MRVHLTEIGLRMDGRDIAVESAHALTECSVLLGPSVHEKAFGGGRTAHWLKHGIIVLARAHGSQIVSVMFCFSGADGPYDHPPHESFEGDIEFGGLSVTGGETEHVARSVLGASGLGSIVARRVGQLVVNLHLTKPRGASRSSRRCLTQLSAEWPAATGLTW
ncbi:MAG: hypothetical protein IPJ34_26710 [Myxococcales bacterium]|nr:hypothetical protein [Myxococcales bacterium]